MAASEERLQKMAPTYLNTFVQISGGVHFGGGGGIRTHVGFYPQLDFEPFGEEIQ